MKTFFIDFDGTICDFWERMYRVFIDCGHIRNVSLENYKNAKKTLFKDSLIAKRFGQDLSQNYYQDKKLFLEKKAYLDLDSLIADKKKLNYFFKTNNAFIISKRRNKDNLMWEIKKMGLLIDEGQVIVINPDTNVTKYAYLEKHCHNNFVLVGDSKEESAASCLENCEVYLVKTGICDYDKNIKNCYYINNINDFLMKWSYYGI